MDNTKCVCEKLGYFCSGIPGIVARVCNGHLVDDATVERCDLCKLYESDEEALKVLHKLNMV